MKIYTLLFWSIIGISFIFHSCKSTKPTHSFSPSEIKNVYLFQNDKETLIRESDESISVNKSKFAIRFYNKKYDSDTKAFYAAQIAAFLEKDELMKVNEGMSKSDLACFEPGSGMATNKNDKYESLIFKNSGHHYLVYENSESGRLNLIGAEGDYLKLEFIIEKLFYDNRETKMSNTTLSEFYLAILIDRNLNGIIDKGELTKLTIKIE